jgi:IS5 family transposase
MLGKLPLDQKQHSLFGNNLIQILNLKHPLIKLANQVPWSKLETDLAHLYARRGAPSHPLRKMVGLLFLQHIFKLSDERIVEVWQENPYYQYFTGEASLAWHQPCAASDLVHFRKRIGEKGAQMLLKTTLGLHESTIKKTKEVLVDTTVQEKNITHPTDAKLYKKVIDKCVAISKDLKIKLRQSYLQVSRKLMYVQRYINHPKQFKVARKAIKKLKTIAGRQVRDLVRNLGNLGKEAVYKPILDTMTAILAQTKDSKNKIYSLHEPSVSCIAKGKQGKRYEFGSKVSISSLPGSQVIVGISNYQGNPHDSQTIVTSLALVEDLTGKRFDRVIVDRGYRGVEKKLKETVILPGRKGLSKKSYAYKIHLQRCRKRSAIEALISHVKNHHKLGRNYLKGQIGDVFNSLLVAVGHNLQLSLIN